MRNIVFGSALVAALITGGSQLQAHPFDSQDSSSARVLLAQGRQLGVMVEDTATGVKVGEVTTGGAAEKAGIKAGDIIVSFDGERVRSARHLTRLVQETADGKSVKVTVTRDGKQQTLDATPAGQTFSWNMDGSQIPGYPFSYRFEGPRAGVFENLMPSSRGRLGVQVQTLTPQLQEYFGAKEGGALVATVTKDSAAEKAGIKAGDVIVSINGDKVTTADELTSEIAGKSGEITIGVVRDRKQTTIKAALSGLLR